MAESYKIDKTLKTSVTLMTSVLDLLDAEAEKDCVSRSYKINMILAQYYKAKGKF